MTETGGKQMTLTQIAERIAQTGEEGRKEVSAGELLDALGSNGHYALLVVIAAIATSPLSGIPGLTAISGLLIALISGERLIARRDVYLPGALKRRGIDKDRVHDAIEKAKPWIERVDRFTRRRLSFLFRPPMLQLMLSVCVLSGLTMPFMEIVPFTGSILAAGVLIISTALVTKDGLIALFFLVPFSGFAFLLYRTVS